MRLLGNGVVLSLLPFFLGLFSAVAASDPATNAIKRAGKGCSKLEVRREWRALSDGERAQWLGAVKVKRFL